MRIRACRQVYSYAGIWTNTRRFNDRGRAEDKHDRETNEKDRESGKREDNVQKASTKDRLNTLTCTLTVTWLHEQ